MVNIDTVYQKVLALANKEQRGYVTPQEFNLLADKAQKEIFESYFHDLKTAHHKRKAHGEKVDEIEMLEEKRDMFRRMGSLTVQIGTFASTPYITPSDDVYSIATMYLETTGDTSLGSTTPGVAISNPPEITKVDRQQLLYMNQNPLTKPTLSRPVYVHRKSGTSYVVISQLDFGDTEFMFQLYPDTIQEGATVGIDYWKKPTKPEWAYIVVNPQGSSPTSLYNPIKSTHFELHASEEENVVNKILQLIGIVIEKTDVLQGGMMLEANTLKKQND